MILNDTLILEWASTGGIRPFSPTLVNPASIDLRWSGRYKFADPMGWSETLESSTLTIPPGKLLLLDTLETVTIPDDVCGTLMLKSSIGRQGLEHLHAGFFDPGFTGTATLEIFNAAPWPVTLLRGQRIVQLKLERMVARPQRSYRETGRYNGQNEPQEAK